MNRQLPEPGTVEIAPSILSADFARLAEEIAVVASTGVKMIHLDVMDGHFVPNITIGPPVIAKLRKHSDLFFDSHLMISEPDRYLEAFAQAGVDNITFHIEVTDEPARMVDKIRALGCTAEITLNIKGGRFVGHDTSNDMYTSIDGAVDKIVKQLSRIKDRVKYHKSR